MRVVLYQKEMGVYLGSCLGLGFWSKFDPVGQDMAATFANSAEASKAIKNWDNIPEGIRAVPVHSEDGYATRKACMDAGLPDWDPDPANYL